MRILITTILCFLALQLSNCKSSQKIKQEVTQEKTLLKNDSLENGSKKLYLLKNKKLEVVQNEGYISYTIIDNDKTNVVQYVYAINQDQVAYDGGYREEVVFEIPNDDFDTKYKDEELQKTKMLFGRYCFCRGKTGVYKIMQGNLQINSNKKEFHFELDFNITEVPQVIEKISY